MPALMISVGLVQQHITVQSLLLWGEYETVGK